MGTYFVIIKIVICILPGVRTEVVILTTHIVISHTGAGAKVFCIIAAYLRIFLY